MEEAEKERKKKFVSLARSRYHNARIIALCVFFLMKIMKIVQLPQNRTQWVKATTARASVEWDGNFNGKTCWWISIQWSGKYELSDSVLFTELSFLPPSFSPLLPQYLVKQGSSRKNNNSKASASSGKKSEHRQYWEMETMTTRVMGDERSSTDGVKVDWKWEKKSFPLKLWIIGRNWSVFSDDLRAGNFHTIKRECSWIVS